eukprot:1159519-Pelagomonas_calceolata.AAC.8
MGPAGSKVQAAVQRQTGIGKRALQLWPTQSRQMQAALLASGKARQMQAAVQRQTGMGKKGLAASNASSKAYLHASGNGPCRSKPQET